MGVMSKRMQSQELQKIFMQFAQQNEKMDMMEEMMGDAIDDAMSDDEAEEDEIVNQVFEELKIDMFSDQVRHDWELWPEFLPLKHCVRRPPVAPWALKPLLQAANKLLRQAQPQVLGMMTIPAGMAAVELEGLLLLRPQQVVAVAEE